MNTASLMELLACTARQIPFSKTYILENFHVLQLGIVSLDLRFVLIPKSIKSELDFKKHFPDSDFIYKNGYFQYVGKYLVTYTPKDHLNETVEDVLKFLLNKANQLEANDAKNQN